MRILIYSVLFFLLGAQFLVSAQVKDKQQIIKVGVYDNPPKIFMNKDGYPDGIFIDILKTIAGKENLKVEYTFGEWSQLLVMLRKGEIDVLPDVAYSQKRACVYSLSQPVLSSWLQVFTTRETVINTINNLQDKKIGVLKTSIQEEYLNNRLNGETELGYKIFTYDDYNNSIKALKNHDIDLIVANRFFYFSKFYDNNLLPTSVILDFTELHFAFTKDVNDNLVNIFDKNIISMKNNPKSDYYISLLKWFNKDYEKKIPKYIFIILIAIILFFLVVVVFALMLNYKIKEKTKILHLKNEELTAAKEKAEEHDKLKTVFLQNMSHEIRTPMNAILGFLSFLKNPELDEKNKNEYLDIINVNGERLLTTINNIFEISKIESNQICVQYSEVNIKTILDYYYQKYIPLANKKGLTIKLSEQLNDETLVVETDRNILDIILVNLLDNALKFTNNGYIELGYSLKENSIAFFIKDTGVGIPSDRINAIFERFIQADLKITRAHEGNGLGLAIVKAYIEKLNGKIWIESEVGIGSTFFFSIPYTPR
ncbi:MAG: transporter substrate-binding domain-containing protein [Bacteroidales bacterium]|jgi:hypothetical protein